jgi:hypothetical protein
VAQHVAVRPRGPASSALLAGRLVWVFGATYSKQRPTLRLVSSAVTTSSLDQPYALGEAAADAPAPSTFVPDLAADLAQLAPGETLDYALGSLIAIGLGDALLYYTPIKHGSEDRAGTPLGTRLARVTASFDGVTAAPAAELLFPAAAPAFRSGMLAADGYLYLYGCARDDDTIMACKLARVAVSEATQPRAYQYRTSGGWSNDLTVTRPVLRGLQETLSLSYNDYLRRYLVVAASAASGHIQLHTAARPEGPWSLLGELSSPPSASAAVEHAELASQCGKRVSLTYLSASGELVPLELTLQ